MYLLFTDHCGISDAIRGGGVYESYLFDCLRAGRPLAGELACDDLSQRRVGGQPARLGPTGGVPRGRIRRRGAVGRASAMARDLAADGRWGTAQALRDHAIGDLSGEAARDVLPIRRTEDPRRPPPLRRRNTAVARHVPARVDR